MRVPHRAGANTADGNSPSLGSTGKGEQIPFAAYCLVPPIFHCLHVMAHVLRFARIQVCHVSHGLSRSIARQALPLEQEGVHLVGALEQSHRDCGTGHTGLPSATGVFPRFCCCSIAQAHHIYKQPQAMLSRFRPDQFTLESKHTQEAENLPISLWTSCAQCERACLLTYADEGGKGGHNGHNAGPTQRITRIGGPMPPHITLDRPMPWPSKSSWTHFG